MRVRLAVLALLPLVAAGCFEDPVSETLLVQMLGDDAAAVTATVSLQSGGDEGPLLARLQGIKREYLHGQDSWSRRFERVPVEYEERTLIRDRREPKPNGKAGEPFLDLSKIKHMVVVRRAEVGFLLSDSGVSATLGSSGGFEELLIVPGGGSLSSSEQRRVLKTHLNSWSASAETYFKEVSDLYGYLARVPDRSTAVFAHVFDDMMEKADLEAAPLLEGEEKIVEDVKEAMKSMADDLGGLEEIPYGLNELAYLVYDPLPAAVTVCIPTQAEEVEGFVAKGDRCYSIPRRGIIEAFNAMDGRWVSPDPFVTWIRIHRSEGQEHLDLASFAAKPRSVASLPTASEILKTLEAGMRHDTSYRLRWVEPSAERVRSNLPLKK
jgi:hypothetical protein